MAKDPRSDASLKTVRAELRRMGYLDQGFGRFLLQDALKPRRPLSLILDLTLKVAGAGGVLLALILTFVLAEANGNLDRSPFDLVPLFLHLLVPMGLLVGAVFLVVCGAVVGLLHFTHLRRIEVVSFGAALLSGLGLATFVLWRFSGVWVGGSPAVRVVGLVAVLAAVFLVVKVLESGLLGLAIRLTEQAPGRRFFSRRWLVAALALALAVVFLPVLLAFRPPPVTDGPHLPELGGGRVLVVGIDGVLPEEADYLLGRRALPGLTSLREDGGHWLRYRRPAQVPATFWTTLATGLGEAEHGVASVDSFRPLGVETPLARNGPLRLYWQKVAVPLGLAVNRPVLAAQRRAPAFWELAARGGQPIAAVNWWATFPAEPLPGLVVAHGAYQLLREGAAGAVASSSRPEIADAVEERARTEPQSPEPLLAAALPPELAAELEEKATAPDRFYLEALEEALTAQPRVAAAYFPALDLAADAWPGSDLAFTDLLRAQLQEIDALVAAHLEAFDAVLLVLDPGRRPTSGGKNPEGRALLWRRAGCEPTAPAGALPREVQPTALTAAVLRALGLPQSEELPPPPPVCPWPPAPETVPTYGRRDADGHPGAPPPDDEEYLRSLRSLGYL